MSRVPPEQLKGLVLLHPEERLRLCSEARYVKERDLLMRFEATVQALASELRYQAYKTNSGRCLLTLRACGELDGPDYIHFYNPLNEDE